MHSRNRLAKLAGAAMLIAFTITLALTNAGNAFAATTSSAPAHTTAVSHARPAVDPKLAPKGCNNGNFCSYNGGNGGSLCFQTNRNTASWPADCRDHNDSAYNRNPNSVDLYYLINYSDAYYILYQGNYLLYMNQNKFNECSNNCVGEGQPLQNNVESNFFN
jgi:hypothetical protein